MLKVSGSLLGFYTMDETLKRGLRLKAICVKNFEETLAKRGQITLWKYRALKSGTFFFKHEYIIILPENDLSKVYSRVRRIFQVFKIFLYWCYFFFYFFKCLLMLISTYYFTSTPDFPK